MTFHYHGTPITPNNILESLAGRCFCVSHANPQNIEKVHEIGQSVMLDNGAFSKWKSGKDTKWEDYYEWCSKWLSYSTTWAVIPDIIDGSEIEQDELLLEWPFKEKGAPVYHMNENIERLDKLIKSYDLVCIGSTSEFSSVMNLKWQNRMDEIWDMIMKKNRFPPKIHMLRGMRCCKERWPFYSVDSTDVARNHHIKDDALERASKWDKINCYSFKNKNTLEDFLNEV